MGVAFLKKGAKAQKVLEKENAKEAAAKEASGALRRFWIPEDVETTITFLDGDLDEDGLLENGVFYEHQLEMNGHWRNWFVCTEGEEPCPICEDGNKSAMVSAFTVIDHSKWKDSNGVTHQDELKLYVAKRTSLKLLQKMATKRGGLAGCTFEVGRNGDKSPGIGNVFDFEGKEKDLPKLFKIYKVDGPVDYEEVLHYRTAKELHDEFGFGSTVIGSEDTDWDEDKEEQFDEDDI